MFPISSTGIWVPVVDIRYSTLLLFISNVPIAYRASLTNNSLRSCGKYTVLYFVNYYDLVAVL